MTTKHKRLYGPALLSATAATVYTVPAATLTLVGHVHVINISIAPVGFSLSIGPDGAGSRLFDAYAIGPGQQLDLFIRVPLEAGELLQAYAAAPNVLTLTISGQEITPG